MLNLLVAGMSRDKAGAERELISLCRKTIIRLIEPPGSETLQPEIAALAEQAERAGDDPWAGRFDPGSRERGSPEPGGGIGPALSREQPQSFCALYRGVKQLWILASRGGKSSPVLGLILSS